MGYLKVIKPDAENTMICFPALKSRCPKTVGFPHGTVGPGPIFGCCLALAAGTVTLESNSTVADLKVALAKAPKWMALGRSLKVGR